MRFRSILSAASLILLFSAAAQAGPRHGRVVVRERGYVEIRHGGRPYFYRDGFYYRRVHHGYYLAPAPVGLVVRVRPARAVILRSGGVTFYYSSGVYYREVPEGYVVVSRPETVLVEDAPSGEEAKEFSEPAAETVMVENSNGSKTPVRLEKSGAQWKGPRGELYDSLPGNAQLRPVYGF